MRKEDAMSDEIIAQVGDKVRVIREDSPLDHKVKRGAVGVIRAKVGPEYAVEFTEADFRVSGWHTCSGHVPSGYGNWLAREDFEVIEPVGRGGAARKDDIDKLRYDLIPARFMAELAHVYTAGAKKYEPHNWRKGLAWSRVVGALLRHVYEWLRYGPIDPEDYGHRLAKVAWCCATLIEYEATHPELCDLEDRKAPSVASCDPTERKI
jgi:hypothetical protein